MVQKCLPDGEFSEVGIWWIVWRRWRLCLRHLCSFFSFVYVSESVVVVCLFVRCSPSRNEKILIRCQMQISIDKSSNDEKPTNYRELEHIDGSIIGCLLLFDLSRSGRPGCDVNAE